MRSLSIRWRMTVWNTIAFAIVLVAFGVLVYSLLLRTHLKQVDRALASRLAHLQQLARAENDPEPPLRRWTKSLHKQPSLTELVFDAAGNVVAHDERLDEPSVSTLTANRPALRQFASRNLPPLGKYRLLAGEVHSQGDNYTVLLAASLDHVNEEMNQVVGALAITIPSTLLVAAGLAYILARKSLAPIERLRRLTDEITAERLNHRLPIDNPNDELGRLTATINEMSSRLERSFAEIRRFTADASHELRTPVTVIRAEVEEYLDRVPADCDSGPLLQSVLEECERLTSLTDRLLTLCREDAGAANTRREPVNLADLVDCSVEAMQPLAEAKQQRLTVTADRNVHAIGDCDRLRDVVRNLLDNAIKYTPSGGAIEVGVERQESDAVLTVSDKGIGIPPEHLSRVFDRFYRVDNSRNRTAGGVGLGLSIAQSIVTAHGGRIEVTSTAGKGSTFRVCLPGQREEQSRLKTFGVSILDFVS